MLRQIFKPTLAIFVYCFFVLLYISIVAADLPKAKNQNSVLKSKYPNVSEKLKKLLNCKDRKLFFEKDRYGDYWLLRNLFIGEKSRDVKCAETITLTTIGDYTFLESLPIVVRSWLAPISCALYAPGFDFEKTMQSIQYLRHCLHASNLIRDYVSFHVFFLSEHLPKYVPPDENGAKAWNYSCADPAPYLNVSIMELYRKKANLTYPINVGRNIARKAANTHFIFASDIELIPSARLATQFLEMITKNISILHGNRGLRVFPLPVFELRANATIPHTKVELLKMLDEQTAIPFHVFTCAECHLVPNQTLWVYTPYEQRLSVVAVGKRQGEFRYWEPAYISDNRVPVFDERVTWEGRSNKRIQNFAMCLLGYEYHVLHPAFLVHMPGIKHFEWSSREAHVPAMNQLIQNVIDPEYRILYGKNPNCTN